MDRDNAAVRRYLRQVRSWLPCGGKPKRDIIDRIRANVADYALECPKPDYDAIVARFGTPQQIAATYVDEMETAELLDHLRIRRIIVRIISVTAAIFVAIWLGVVTMAATSHYEQMDGYIDVEVAVEERTELKGGK